MAPWTESAQRKGKARMVPQIVKRALGAKTGHACQQGEHFVQGQGLHALEQQEGCVTLGTGIN